MECVVVAIALVGLVLFVAVIAMNAGRLRSGSWNAAFEHVARRFHGQLAKGGLFGQPSAWLRHGEATGRLTIMSVAGSPGERCLQMTLQQREINSRCEIFHHQTRPGLAPLPRGLARVTFDWEHDDNFDFHSRWQVLGSHREEARHMLSDGVKLAIEHLWRHPLPSEMTISLSPGWIVVRKVWSSQRGIDLEEFVEKTCALADQISLAAAAGIEFIASDEAQLLDAARCAICGDNLAAEIVVCRRCNTPHHRDCWEYGGGCATYGCGGRECVRPGLAPLAGPHFHGEDAAPIRRAKPR